MSTQVSLITNMNWNAPNSMSINSKVRISNLEYVSFNLFIKLFYNYLIFAHFFIVYQLQNTITCSSLLLNDATVMLFYFYRSGMEKWYKISEHYCNSVLYEYYDVYSIFLEDGIEYLTCKHQEGAGILEIKCSQVCQGTTG